MTIEQLDSTRLMVDLLNDDLNALGLDYEAIGLNDPATRRLLRRLMTLAGIKTGMDFADKSLTIEALPYDKGCILLVTLSPREKKRKPKRYRIKKDMCYCMFLFETTDDFLSAIRSLYEQGKIFTGSMAYSYNNRLYLIVYAQKDLSIKAKYLLSEFSSAYTQKKTSIARVLEHGHPIVKHHAIMYIGSAIL